MCPYGLMGNRIPATVGAHLHDFCELRGMCSCNLRT